MANPLETAQEIKKDDETRITEEIEKDTLVELETGMGGERERLPGMPKEHSGWDVYNNEAKKVDTELVNDWRDSLNSLLLFAAIFAAVLTAFIIESKKLLELDPSNAMLNVMISFTNSMANGSFTPYSPPHFEPESSSIIINSLFFASLSASLVAALASVVALQWVADYDAAITRGGSSPEDRAKRRQFRYAGVVWWKMSEIIAALPLLLYSSVILFFSGLTLWMWTVHHTVGAVVAGGMGLAVLFYGTTTLLSVASVSAPFRTPLSRFIYSTIYIFFSVVDSLSRILPIPSSKAWLQERHERYTGAVKRDDEEVNRRHWLGMDALVWLANHLSISPDSYERLLLLVNELRKQDQTYFTSPGFKEAPWFPIFDLLGWRNLNTAGQDEDISKEEMRAVAILAHCYRVETIYQIIRPTEEILYYSDDNEDEYWSQYCDIARPQWSAPSTSTTLNSLFLLLRDIPLPSKDTATQVEFTIRISRWRNSLKSALESPTGGAGPSIVLRSPATPDASTVFVGPFLKHDGEDLWFTRDCSSLYRTIVGRIMDIYVKGGAKMAPFVLDMLRRRFEQILLEKGDQYMEVTSCLSRPLLYANALQVHYQDFIPLHGDFTLLLARNIQSFSGVERARRVKEVITMMWVRDNDPWHTIHEKQGMESFFDANRSMLMGWASLLRLEPHIHEILEHLARAQTEQPDIGSLWRPVTSRMNLDNFWGILLEFQTLIQRGVTDEQHTKLIEFVCRDIELISPKIRTNESTLWRRFSDPCLAFIAEFYTGAGDAEIAEECTLRKGSWERIAMHVISYYEGTTSLKILKVQALAWPLIPEYVGYVCVRALREPQTLAWLQSMFQFPVKCHEGRHNVNEGHLLLHIFGTFRAFEYWKFPVDIPTLTDFPMKNQAPASLLTMLILWDGYEEQLRGCMHGASIDERCTSQLLEMASRLASSQHSILAILLAVNLPRPSQGYYIDDLAAFSICVNRALDLPDDLGVTSLIGPLMSRMHALIGDLREGEGSGIATREATKTVDRLNIYLARLRFSSRRNSRVLACARVSSQVDLPLGWLPPYMG